MKKLILIVLVFLFYSCDGIFGVKDFAGSTKNIEDAKKSKLLKNVYTSSKSKVLIDSEEYKIIESWTSYRYKTNKSNILNKDFFEFLIIIKNNKTKQLGLSPKTTPNLSKFVKIYEQSTIDIVGIVNNKLSISYDAKKNPNSPNIIKVGFKSGSKEDLVIFKKN